MRVAAEQGAGRWSSLPRVTDGTPGFTRPGGFRRGRTGDDTSWARAGLAVKNRHLAQHCPAPPPCLGLPGSLGGRKLRNYAPAHRHQGRK